MAPIPTIVNNPDMPSSAAVFLPWLMWLVIVIFGIAAAVLLGWLTRQAASKIIKAIAARKERQEEATLVLPTHLDSFTPRAVVLPLACSQDQETQQTCEEEKSHEDMHGCLACVDEVRVRSLWLSACL
jgi:uncharacterized membrane protein YraQ (UPF0718 family)